MKQWKKSFKHEQSYKANKLVGGKIELWYRQKVNNYNIKWTKNQKDRYMTEKLAPGTNNYITLKNIKRTCR